MDVGYKIAYATKDIEIPPLSVRYHIYRRKMKQKKGWQEVLIVEEKSTLVK